MRKRHRVHAKIDRVASRFNGLVVYLLSAENELVFVQTLTFADEIYDHGHDEAGHLWVLSREPSQYIRCFKFDPEKKQLVPGQEGAPKLGQEFIDFMEGRGLISRLNNLKNEVNGV